MFTRDNSGICFAFQGFEPQNYGTALSTALAAGRGPDVIHIRAYGGLEQFSKAGYLEPLSPQTVPELANYTPSALASVTDRSDRKPYAVPFASQTLGIFYNRDVLSRNGVQPPETWDQLIAACKALKDKGVIPLANGMATAFMAEIFTAALTLPLHGKAFNDDLVAGKATFEDPRYVGALAKLLELREYMPTGFTGIDYPTMQQLFLSGRAGRMVTVADRNVFPEAIEAFLLTLPGVTRAGTVAGACCVIHASQYGHHEPGVSLACATQSSKRPSGFPPVQW
jgi:raffinose/stachyose/melibiose transport system substrate-binding protein